MNGGLTIDAYEPQNEEQERGKARAEIALRHAAATLCSHGRSVPTM